MCDFKIWRRVEDSNPRDPLGPSGFQDRYIRPLCQLSKAYNYIASNIIIWFITILRL